MKSTIPSRRKQGRTKKKGLLTDNEQAFLKRNSSFTQKQKWTFLNSLLPRIEACSKDAQLLWQSKDIAVKKWLTDNWNNLYNCGENFHPRHYSELKHYRPGHIKSRLVKGKGKKRGMQLYWLDERDKTHSDYNDLPWPDHLVRKTKPLGVKQQLKQSLLIEEKFWYRKKPANPLDLKKEIMPRNKESALEIKEIRKRTEQFKKKLNLN